MRESPCVPPLTRRLRVYVGVSMIFTMVRRVLGVLTPDEIRDELARVDVELRQLRARELSLTQRDTFEAFLRRPDLHDCRDRQERLVKRRKNLQRRLTSPLQDA
jgi:hypothetical protein